MGQCKLKICLNRSLVRPKRTKLTMYSHSSIRSRGPSVPDFWTRAILAHSTLTTAHLDAGLKAAELPNPYPQAPDQEVTTYQEMALLRALAESTGRDCLAAEIAMTYDPRIGALPIYITFAGETLGEQMGNLKRYIVLSRPNTRLYVDQDEMAVAIAIENSDPRVSVDIQHSEFALAAVHRIIQVAAGKVMRPTRLRLANIRVHGEKRLEQIFGCPVELGAPRNEIWYGPDLLEQPSVTADNRLQMHLRAYGDILLRTHNHHDPAIIQRVEAAVLKRLNSGLPSLAVIAGDLSMSPRTLSRKMAEQDTGYRDVVDTLRRDLAETYLGDHEISLAEIAFLLGYHDQSGFGTAYRRWAGKTPGEARAKLFP